MNGRINQELFENLCDGLANYTSDCELFYNWPSEQTLVDSDALVFIAIDYVTISHQPKEKKWCINSWGEFSKKSPNIYDFFSSDNGCSGSVAIRMRKISERYLKTINRANSRESRVENNHYSL